MSETSITNPPFPKHAPAKAQEIVRVLRLVQYVGPRDQVEETLTNSIHGTRRFATGRRGSGWGPVDVEITAVTIGTFPEILNQAEGDAWIMGQQIAGQGK